MASSVSQISRYEGRRKLKRELESRLALLAVGEPLPPVRSLMQEYGTSITRLNSLFKELEDEGQIERRQGAGIFKAGQSQDNSAGSLDCDAGTIRVAVLLDNWPNGSNGRSNFGVDLFSLIRQQASNTTGKYHVSCDFSDFVLRGEEDLDRLSESRQVDAVVAMPYTSGGLELMRRYRPKRNPVFCFFRQADSPAVPSIYIDYYQGACKAVEYLCDLGHRRIGFIGMPVQPGNPAWHRDLGYRDTLKARGIESDPCLIRHLEHNHQDICRAVHGLLHLDDPITALFTADGLVVSSALYALSEAGKAIPGDISLLCYDDEPDCRTYRTPISVVRQPLAKTVDTLLRQISARLENLEYSNQDQVILPELLLRESCRRRE